MITFYNNASLLPFNTFGMDVKCALLVEYDQAEELPQLLTDARVMTLMQKERNAGRLPFWHIGGGSNLLFRGDYPGVVLHRRANEQPIRVLAQENVVLLEVQAGTTWDDVCAYCAKEGLYGPENLSLIPGEMGAAAVQNIGAYGVELKDLVHEVVCMDAETHLERRFNVAEMQYAYRDSLLKHAEAKSRYIVTSVVLKVLKHGNLHLEYAGLKSALCISDSGNEFTQNAQPSVQKVRDAVIAIRQGKLPDPKLLGNAGSFFKNPVVENSIYEHLAAQYEGMPHYKVDETHIKIPAGWMIEQCGWKGKSLGHAGVYEKQSLVLVNRGGATPKEIVTLCETVIQDVEKKFGIRIEPEVNLI